jgi:O-6-methylguanine DNA methyltransferase
MTSVLIHAGTHFGELSLSWTGEIGAERVGRVELISSRPRIRAFSFADFSKLSDFPKALLPVIRDLKNYFENGVPLPLSYWDKMDLGEVSEFQSRVYRAVTLIPHGETRTYSWVANRLGTPGASRAVGQALKQNPIPILIPCHRVVGSQALGGFMGKQDPGLPETNLKKSLIEWECAYVNPVFPFLNEASFAKAAV